jgi:hypothetical protein
LNLQGYLQQLCRRPESAQTLGVQEAQWNPGLRPAGEHPAAGIPASRKWEIPLEAEASTRDARDQVGGQNVQLLVGGDVPSVLYRIVFSPRHHCRPAFISVDSRSFAARDRLVVMNITT